MNIQIKKYIDPIVSFWGNLTKKKKTIVLIVAGVIVLVSVIVGILLNMQPYVVLYPGMEQQEAVQVMNELRERNISYKEDNGTIYVPEDKENALRMELANEGYPKTAPNYDFFTNNVDIMSTDFEKKTIEKYQLNQRLEAVIKTLDCIKNANVTISIPENSGYAWDENAETTTASVTVTLATGKTLEGSQVNGIKQLVAKSVPNLKADDVAVIDTGTGNELSGSDEGSQVNISQFKLQIEKEFENDIEKSVLKVLTPVFGQDNVKVTAKSVMDVDKKVQEIITYNPSQDNKGVINESDVQKEQEKDGKKTGGSTGTESNTETTTYPGVTVDGDTIYTKDSESYKYLVSQVKQQIQGDAASVKDMTISIAVNKETMGDAQKQDIAKLAAYAAAIEPDKVAVYNSVFPNAADQPTSGPVSAMPPLNQILILGGAAVLTLLIVIIVVVIVARRRKKKRMLELAQLEGTENPEGSSELKDRLDDTPDSQKNSAAEIALKAIEDARAEKASKEEALTKEIQDFSSQNPEIAAQLIRSWLRGDDGNG